MMHGLVPRVHPSDTLLRTVPIAVLAFDFDPLLRLAEGLVVRWQTLALAAAIAATLILAALIARRGTLRLDDMLFIAVGTVPGAVIAGRLGYLLLHFEYYAANPSAILDPGLGAMELAFGVVGGLLTGSYVASLLGAPVGRWWHTAVLPVLILLGIGKLTMILGGAGQGMPSTAPWATAFLGPGPWGSLAPALPSDPSQAYESIATLIILVVVMLALAFGGFGRRDGRVLFAALAAWAFARAAVATTWRDAAVVGPLNMGTLIAIGVGVGCLLFLGALTARARRRPVDAGATSGSAAGDRGLSWPDPSTRPPF
jgi:prolipoprotein diacylglyceryltransferase